MTAALDYTYALTTPRRPDLADLGGADFLNDPAAPPPDDQPNAAELNQKARNLEGLNRVCPLALILVTFSSGAPLVTTVRGMRGDLAPGNFVVSDNGDGDTSITWASSLLPGLAMPPLVAIAEDVDVDRVRAFLTDGGVRVKTKLGVTGIDAAFVLSLF